MICIDDCSNCKHERPLKDGWRFACDAFPDGAPRNFPFGKVKELKECHNGIGYEPKEEKLRNGESALYRNRNANQK